MKKILVIAAVAAASAAASAFAEENVMRINGSDKPAYVEGELIVKYKDGAARSYNQMVSAYNRLGVVDVLRFSGVFKNLERLVIEKGQATLEEAMAELDRDPDVEYVQPNYLLYAHEEREPSAAPCRIPGIPYPLGCVDAEEVSADSRTATVPGRRGKPGIKAAPADVSPPRADTSLSKTWGLKKIGATSAWAKQRGSRNVIVAVIDSGVDYNHPDLAANMWRNPGYSRYQATGVDVEGQAVTGDLVGWNFVHNDNLPWDDNRHGTHVAGTIGAVGANGKGVSGVNQRVSLMAVKFLTSSGSGSTSNAIKGIDYAVSRGAKVLNNSWGSKNGQNRALMDAILRSEKKGVLFVASAGNDGTDNDRSPSYPASYTYSNVMSVASTTSSDKLSSFSNRGRRTVHVGAPGSSIYSTLPSGRYGTLSGTSMAAPHVAGAAALLWAQNPEMTYKEIKKRLMDTGDALSALKGRTISGRRINVLRALGQ